MPVGLFGRADVVEAGVGVGGDHRADVVGQVRRQGDLLHRRPQPLGGPAGELEGGIGGDQAAGRRAEGDHRARQRIAGAGPRRDVIGWHVLDRRHRPDEVAALVMRGVAVAQWDDRRCGGGARRHRAGPALVGADPDFGGGGRVGDAGRGPGRTPHARGRRRAKSEHRRDAAELPARKAAAEEVVLGFFEQNPCHESLPRWVECVELHPSRRRPPGPGSRRNGRRAAHATPPGIILAAPGACFRAIGGQRAQADAPLRGRPRRYAVAGSALVGAGARGSPRTKARMSALIRSGCVVMQPCGSPW